MIYLNHNDLKNLHVLKEQQHLLISCVGKKNNQVKFNVEGALMGGNNGSA